MTAKRAAPHGPPRGLARLSPSQGLLKERINPNPQSAELRAHYFPIPASLVLTTTGPPANMRTPRSSPTIPWPAEYPQE
jgi:hypothetical protein